MEQKSDIKCLNNKLKIKKNKYFEYQSPSEMLDDLFSLGNIKRNEVAEKISNNFSRLPISLAQLKAGNNFEKLKNEIRQLFYSLYRSKKLTKNIYKSLIDIISRGKQIL